MTAPDQTGSQKMQEQPGVIGPLKQLYTERPGTFAAGLIGVTALIFLLGDVGLGRLFMLQPIGMLRP